MKQMDVIYNLSVVALLLALIYLSTTNERTVRNMSRRLTSGYVNTILILCIISLSMYEDKHIGFIVAVIYLVLVVRFQELFIENFKSGPSPLNCSTYGDSKERTGSAYYPINP